MAYATHWVMSTAANVWGETQERYALKGTNALWHASTVDPEAHVSARSARQKFKEDKAMLIEFFQEKVTSPQHKAAIIDLLQNPDNTQAEVRLRGQRLGEAGLATQVFSEITSMKEHLTVQTGWIFRGEDDEDKGEESASPDPIETFFEHSLNDQLGDFLHSGVRKNGGTRVEREGATNSAMIKRLREILAARKDV